MNINDLKVVLDALHLPSFWVDADSRIAVCNLAAVALFDPGLIGRHYLTALRQPRLVDAIESVRQNRISARDRFVTSSGNREMEWTVRAEPLVCDERPGVLVTLEDTTAVQEVGQMRRDFVANVSHELRTPLTALIGFIETLRGAARDDAAARDRFLAIMTREATRMNRLVQDLLSLSRLESEERLRPTGRVDLSGLMTSIRQSLSPLLADNDVTLTLDGCDNLPTIPGDGDQLRQVFTNLIENAVKYGGRGKVVTVTAVLIDRDAGLRAPAVQLDVQDRGEGIDPMHIPRLTERFYRVDAHRSREMGGTGLGLAIVKHIVGRHRGRLRILSATGQGSTFCVTFPTE